MLRALVLILLPCLTSGALAQSAAVLETELKKKPDSVRLREQVANAYAKENKPEKVIELLNAYTDQLDDNGFLLLAMSYGFKKDHANEVRVLKILVNRNEENVKSHMLLAQAYLKQAYENPNSDKFNDRMTAGIQELRRALQVEKKYKPAYDLLVKTLLEQKNNHEAREMLIEGIDRFGERPELYRELCRLDSNDGFLVQAVKECRESIKLSPNYPDQYVYLVQSLQDQGEDEQAERTIVTAAKRFPSSEFVQWAAGTLFFRKKDNPNHSVAARYYRAAVKADPSRSRSQFGLAQSLFKSGQEKESLPYFITACKQDASTLDTFLAAGSQLKQSGNMELGSKFNSEANKCR